MDGCPYALTIAPSTVVDVMNEPHVRVVGINGVRFDSLGAAATPALDRIAGEGFTEVLRAVRPELQTMIAASWHPLATRTDCEPVFSSRGWLPMPDPDEANDADSWVRADDAVAEHAARRLKTEDLAVSFVYFGEADVEAHNNGTGAGYSSAIERCDSRLNALLQAIEARPNRHEEDWTIIVVTDHGHLDAGATAERPMLNAPLGWLPAANVCPKGAQPWTTLTSFLIHWPSSVSQQGAPTVCRSEPDKKHGKKPARTQC